MRNSQGEMRSSEESTTVEKKRHCDMRKKIMRHQIDLLRGLIEEIQRPGDATEL